MPLANLPEGLPGWVVELGVAIGALCLLVLLAMLFIVVGIKTRLDEIRQVLRALARQPPEGERQRRRGRQGGRNNPHAGQQGPERGGRMNPHPGPSGPGRGGRMNPQPGPSGPDRG